MASKTVVEGIQSKSAGLPKKLIGEPVWWVVQDCKK
jgi:hypothetical protein